MPILHKWNRIHRQNKARRQKEQEQQINDMKLTLTHNANNIPNEHDEKKMYVNNRSPTLFIPNGSSNFNLQERQPTSNGHVTSGTTPLLVSTATTNNTDVGATTAIRTATDNERRILSLETKVIDLSVSIDQTLSKVLCILEDLKKKDDYGSEDEVDCQHNNTSKETV